MRAGWICAVSLVCLAGCSPAYLQSRTDEAQNAADVVRSADLRPRFPTPVRDGGGATPQGGGFTMFGASAPPPPADPPPG